jgi:hypothetical protein
MNLRRAVAGRLPVFVAGLYCTLVCVLPVGLAPTAPPAARVFSWLCLVSLPLGLLLPQPQLALLAGMVGVLGGATGTFAAALWAGQTIVPTELGVLGFFVLALAWGALSSPAARQGVGQGVTLDWLTARRRVPRQQVVLARIFLLTLPVLLIAPLRLVLPGQATFALVLSLSLILWLAPLTSDLMARSWIPDPAVAIGRARALRVVAVVALLVLGLVWVSLLRQR